MICKYCGFLIKDGSKFCINCNNPVEPEETKKPETDVSDNVISNPVSEDGNASTGKASKNDPSKSSNIKGNGSNKKDGVNSTSKTNKNKISNNKKEVISSFKNAEVSVEVEENESVVDVEFVEIPEGESATKADLPSTDVKSKYKLTVADMLTIIIGIVLVISLVIGGVIYLVKRSNKKAAERKYYGVEEINGFFNGINERESAICYEYINGSNSNAIYDMIDDRVKAFKGYEDFKVDNIKVTSKERLKGDFLTSMEIKTALDLDKVYLCEVSFDYIGDDMVMPGTATIRTGKSDGKWWIISIKFNDVISGAGDFIDAYNKLDAEKVIDSFVPGVYSEKEAKILKKAYDKYAFDSFGLKNISYKCYKVSGNKLSEVEEEFDDKSLKFDSAVGFTVETTIGNQPAGSEKHKFDLMMVFDDGKWKVIKFDYND